MRDRPVEIEETQQDGTRSLRLRGELDMAGVPVLDQRVRACAGDGTKQLTIDLRGLRFIDSSGIAALVHASKLCEKNGVELELVRGHTAVQRLFVLTGLNDVLPFRDAPKR